MRLKQLSVRALSACLLLASPVCPARADSVPLVFGGASGTPLSVTLTQPVTYTVTTPPSGSILFDFKSVGNVFGGSVNLSGTMTYTVDGGAPISLNVGNTGTSSGAVAATDFLLFRNAAPAAPLGAVIVLSPGTLTTAINIPSAAPASGSYSAILVDSFGNQVGVGVVPEPATVSLLVFGVLFCLRRCRRCCTVTACSSYAPLLSPVIHQPQTPL